MPFIVKAVDECDNKNISLEKVEFVKTNGNAVELSDAKIENQVNCTCKNPTSMLIY